MPLYHTYDSPTRPDPNCRSCADFKTWSRKQREITTKAPSQIHSSGPKGTPPDAPARSDCPLDKDEIGQHAWGLMHTMAAVYPSKPTEQQKRDTKIFYDTMSRLYPCSYCARDFQRDLRENPVNVSSQAALSKWLCDVHNRVNERLGKPQFDCRQVDERWRDGWKDGSCD